MQNQLKARDIQLIVHIISGKPRARPDDTIYLVWSRLKEFLPFLRNKQGEPVTEIFKRPLSAELHTPCAYIFRTYTYGLLSFTYANAKPNPVTSTRTLAEEAVNLCSVL